MESSLRGSSLAMADEAQAVFSGPHEPVARERPVDVEPTVVVAWDSGPTNPNINTNNMRPPADTIPAEREVTVVAVRHSRVHTRLIVLAGTLLFASAGLLAKGVTDPSSSLSNLSRGSESAPVAAAAPPETIAAATAIATVTAPAERAIAAPPPPPVPPTLAVAPNPEPQPVAAHVEPPQPAAPQSAANDIVLDDARPKSVAPSSPSTPSIPSMPAADSSARSLAQTLQALKRGRIPVARRTRGDIVRETPF
jgi:hypothetical protein